LQFVDTTIEDFKAGDVHYNVNITSSPGNVTLNNTKVVAAARIQDIPVDEIGGMDSTLYEIMPNMNYGGATLLDARLSDQVRIVVQFNLSRILDPDWIRRVDLHLKMAQTMTAAATNISVHQLNTSWTEGTGTGQPTGDGVTWTLTDGTNTWMTPGGDFNPVPEDIVMGIRDQLTWYRWNITELVVDWVNGTRQNNGVILIVESAESVTERKRFHSKESALAADHPKLSVMYNATGPTSANGTFISREFDAFTAVNWGGISWDSVVPAETSLSIQTRTGDCSGFWSVWSENYSVESGSRITSPANRCLQYKMEMRTANATLTPILQEVRIENGKSEMDTTEEDFKKGTGFFNVDISSSPGNVTLNDTVLGAPPKIVEVLVDFGNGMDAWIDQASSKKNYGKDTVLVLKPGSNSRALVKFDLSTIQNPQWINRSEVWMMPSPGMTGGIQANISVYQVTTDWIEGTGTGSPSHDGVTWEATDGSTPWTTPGGDFNSVPEFTLRNVTNVPDWHKWNITRLVKEWVNGTTLNAGVLFETHFGGFIADEKVFYSKEYLWTACPKLVVYYNSSGPGQANGTFVSRIMDAQSTVNWGSISWDSIVPAQTELFIHTRTGDCLGSWSGWSQAYSSPLGSQMTSPPNRCLQYKAEMFTYQNGTSPVLEEVRIDYWRYVEEGSIETEDFNPVDWLGWEDFNASIAEPLGTNISFQYSTDAGMFWADIFAGQSLQPLLAQNIKFRANFKTSDPAYTPELYEMNITYRIKNPLDHIHMSLAQWNGTVDDSVDLDAYGHNAAHENVSFTQKWETDDLWGSVNSTGFYRPGRVGTWRIFCNNSDDTISNYTKVTIFPGLIADITISPWDPGTITTDDTLLFNVTGFDSKGNFLGPIIANWSVTGGIGTTTPGPDTCSTFDATTPGIGQVWADDGLGHVNSTNMFQVIVGTRARVGIEPWSPGTLTTNDTVNFTAYDYDLDGNQIGMANVTWSVNGGIGTIPPGPSETAIFDATTVGVGTVEIDDGLGRTNSTDLITVTEGQLSTIVLSPTSVILNAGEQQNFTAIGYDSDGNPVPLLVPLWETNAGTITSSTDNEATLLAQDTELTGGWIRITATSQNSVSASSTVDVVLINAEPEIVGVIPDQEKLEDYGSWSMDLTTHASDAQDPLSGLAWFFTDYDPSLILISGTNEPGNHIITFTTMQNAYGNDQMTAWLRDSDGFVDSQMLYVNITPVNDPPMIQSITPFTVHYDVPYTYYFYDYVSDIETERNGLLLSTDQTDYVTFNGLWGSFLYPQEFNGQTVYPQVSVHDEDGGKMATVVSVTVTEDYVPVLTRELPDVVLYEGETILDYFDLDDYFDDPDQDSLYYTSGNIRTQIIIQDNHSVDFIAPEDWFGVETVTFRAIDPQNARAEDIVLVTVLPIDDAPTISGVPDLVVHYDDPSRPFYNYTFDLEPYIHDIDNSISELTITTSDPMHIFFNYSKNTLMELHYPQSMMGQTVVVRISVSDNTSQDYQDINVTVMDNWPPEIMAPIPNRMIYEDIPFPNALTLDGYFIDIDGDDLSYASVSTNVYVQIDPLTSVVHLSSTANWSGLEYVTFRAIDIHGAVLEQTILVTVIPVNDAPWTDIIPNQEMRKGQTYSLDLSIYIHDIDNNQSELKISVLDNVLDASISVVGTFIIFSYNEEGVDTVQLSVTDGKETIYASISIEVVGPPPPTVWEQMFWPWSLLVALLGLLILFLLSRRFFLRILIDEVFLIHRSGNLIKHITMTEESEIDKDIFSGMLTAIQAFIQDSFREVGDSRVKRIEFGDSKIMMERGETIYLAIVYHGHESSWNVRPLKETIKDIEEKHLEDLEDWDGRFDELSDIEGIIRKHLKAYSKGD
jgi:hypothetical protein